MRYPYLHTFLTAASLILFGMSARGEIIESDICVFGGTSSGMSTVKSTAVSCDLTIPKIPTPEAAHLRKPKGNTTHGNSE